MKKYDQLRLGLELGYHFVFKQNNTTPSMEEKLTYGQGYGRGGTPVFTGVFEPLARVTLYPTDEDGLGTCFGAA